MPKKKAAGLTLGQKVRQGREKMKMTLDELSRETGYDADVLRNVEADGIVPPVSLILQLSRVLKLSVDEAEGEDATKAVKHRTRSHRKRVDSYAYASLTRASGDNHLRAYLVTIDPHQEHKGVEYHHEGEEFVFVLKGELTLQIGETVNQLTKGQSMHFNSALHHRLSNPSEEAAKLLVAIYVP
jgi:quercetin dioxygenase-like cupin family protein/DNA-binding XRE family transcriptional regulator